MYIYTRKLAIDGKAVIDSQHREAEKAWIR